MIKQEEFYGVTVDLVGQTKVTGSSFLTDSLASAVLSRQLEKDHSGVAKFLPDRIHFSRTTSGKIRIYRREVPYNDVLKIYVFPNKPDIFMLCTEGDYEGGRLYQSFRCHNAMDLQTVRRMIYGDANFTARSQIVGGDYYVDRRPGSAVYVEAPRPVTYVKEYLPPPRSPSPTYVERIQTVQRERTPSPVPVRRVSVVQKAVPSPQTVYVQRAQEPVVVRRVRPAEPVVAETVQVQREPSPMFVRRASYVSRPASVVYVDDGPAVEESGPFVLKRVSRVLPSAT
ncbi:hypothetical protein CSKR_101857 [Clonorchis sinensis]|uniref:Uncharacterized protein n=2 Tax=Clonorchis sinensis TaxID=79923 RepID=A0A8T1M6L5_CLOSI|nr:hypothetical protein CSKR_101857 [Clonorchis sinensis]GAA38776.2 hypothetical protein CLF_103859 [Clonorchis sinensis]